MNRSLLLLTAVAALCSGSLSPVRAADLKPVQVIDTDCKDAAVIGVSPDGKRVFCFDRWTLTRIDLVAPGKNKTIPLPPQLRAHRIYTGVHLDDENWLLAVGRMRHLNDWEGPNNRYVIFDFANNTVKADWASHADIGADLLIAPKQNRLIAAGCYTLNDMWFWNLNTKAKHMAKNVLQDWSRNETEDVSGLMQRTAIDPSSSFLGVGLVDNGMVQVWDMNNQIWHPVLQPRKNALLGSLVFLNDRTLAAAWCMKRSGDEYLETFDWKARKRLFRAHIKGFLLHLTAAPGGRVLAVSGWDHDQRETRIRLWDMAAKRELAAFKAYDCYIGAMTFTNDGKKLISIGEDGVLKVWDVDRIVKPPKR